MRFRRSLLEILIGAFVLAAACAGAPARAATFTLSGVVKNEAGQGIANVDLDLIEFCSQTSVFILNDTTLANGTFSIIVNEGTYDVHFTPPAGSTVAASEQEDTAIHANLNLGTITLHPGLKVAGTVKNGAGAVIANVDLDFINRATGRKIFLPGDLTDATGKYSVRVVPGTYDVEYRPPATTTLLTGSRKGLVVGADVTALVDTLGTGVRVSGTVVNANRIALKDADVDLYDICLGETIPTAHDNTDAAGLFAVYVPAGDYTLTVVPPRCTGIAADRLSGKTIGADKDFGEFRLANAFAVSGRVLNSVAQPVPAADLNFYDAATGARQATARDNSNALGIFSVMLPPGTYNIDLSPPAGSGLLAGRYGPVTVTAATAVGDIALSVGAPVSGRLVGPGGAGVGNVNIDVVDSLTRASVLLAHDQTTTDGSFGVVLPPGTWDFLYSPPLCSPLAPAEQGSVTTAAAALTLSTATLVTGVHATGRLLDQGGLPVSGGDLNFFPPGSRTKIFTPRDNTDSTGAYNVLVPPAVYDIDYSPPAGPALRPAQRSGVSLLADTALPNTVLLPGLVVSGFVKSSVTGLGVADATLEFHAPGSSTALLTPHNTTALDGSYAIVVTAGTWDILDTPPAGSGLAPRWTRGIVVASTNVALPDTLLLPIAAPTVTSITPSSGSTTGGQSVTVTGTGFQPDATLSFGGVSASAVSAVSSTTLTAVTPAHAAGVTNVSVTNPANQAGTLTSGYTFLSGPVCGDGVVAGTEQCDAGAANGTSTACCSATCQFKPAASACRPAAGACDTAESCSGTSAACPADIVKAVGTLCRAAAGVCDIAETCPGTSAACPADAVKAAGTVCRASASACDAAENCSGTSAACPADALAANGTICRAATGPCDVAEACSGTVGTCPANALAANGTVCRPAAGACDKAEACSGTSAACPADAVKAAGTVCRAAAGVCDIAETCPGRSAACPADAVKAAGTACNDGNTCTLGDHCQSGVCQGSLRDADADGHPDALCGGNDCNDGNALVWSAPVEAKNLKVARVTPGVTWDSQQALAGTETQYDLVSGSLSSAGRLDLTLKTCLQHSAATAFLDARPRPPAGSAFWYLARARNSCGTGTYGTAQRDASIPLCP